MPGADYRIAWRPKALEDLRSIVRYIAQDSPTRARAFGKKLREKVQPLAQHPLLGHEGRPGLPAGVRELVLHANYIAFYRVIDSSTPRWMRPARRLPTRATSARQRWRIA